VILQSPVVYFVQADGDMVKIGWTTDLSKRLSSLRSSLPQQLELLRRIDGGKVTEKWLHKRFADRRVGGEWFEFCPEMMTIIPPDELPAVPSRLLPGRRSLRLTFTEEYEQLKASGMLDAWSQRQAAFLLVQAMWEDDLEAFLEWSAMRASRGSKRPRTDDSGAAN
jgi:hypothetical protein